MELWLPKSVCWVAGIRIVLAEAPMTALSVIGLLGSDEGALTLSAMALVSSKAWTMQRGKADILPAMRCSEVPSKAGKDFLMMRCQRSAI